MKRLIIWTLVLVGAFFWWRNISEKRKEALEAVAAEQTFNVAGAPNEQAWLAKETVRDLLRLAGNNGELTITKLEVDGDVPVFYFSPPAPGEALSIEKGTWNPATYERMAKALFPNPDTAPPPIAAADVAQQLLNPTLQTFISLDQGLSSFFAEHPSSPTGHLEAALLLGTIALNDYSGAFRDLRPALCRMTAHLAVVDALGSQTDSSERQLAEAIRLTLCGLQVDALKVIEKLAPTNPEWAAILTLRNTLDWRTTFAGNSVAYKNELFRALAYAVDVDFAFSRIGGKDPSLYQSRIANETHLSVEQGHRITVQTPEKELAEIAAAAKAFGVTPAPGDLKWLGEYLRSDSSAKSEVVGRAFFADYHQRHLLASLQKLYGFYQDKWGVPDEAAQLKIFVEKQLPDLRYKPFLMRMMARDNRAREAANVACAELIEKNPGLITPRLWTELRRDEDGNPLSLATPNPDAWFIPEMPRGTAFDASCRLYEIGLGGSGRVAEVWAQAPFSVDLGWSLAWSDGGQSWDKLKEENVKKWLIRPLPYSRIAMRRLARSQQGDPKQYVATMEQLVQLDPQSFLTLGKYFAERNDPIQAEKYYLEAFAKSPDRVGMANESGWIVEHLYKKGDLAKAEEIAKYAAEVYSYRGLETYVWLREQQGKWDEALTYSRKIDERYGSGDRACETGCLMRYYKVNPELAKKAGYDKIVAHVFPKGMVSAKLEDFQGAPKVGVIIKGTGPALTKFGLGRGMIIVALNGYRVDDFAQYDVIRNLDAKTDMRIIAWNGKAYIEKQGDVLGRRFGVDMGPYPEGWVQ